MQLRFMDQRGANGVIVIKTKRSIADNRTTFELSAYTGLGTLTREVDLLKTQEYLLMRRRSL